MLCALVTFTFCTCVAEEAVLSRNIKSQNIIFIFFIVLFSVESSKMISRQSRLSSQGKNHRAKDSIPFSARRTRKTEA